MQSTNKYHELARHKDRKLGLGPGVKAWKTDAYILKRFDAFSVHELAYKGNSVLKISGSNFLSPQKSRARILKTQKARSRILKIEKVSRSHKKNDRLAVSHLPFATPIMPKTN